MLYKSITNKWSLTKTNVIHWEKQNTKYSILKSMRLQQHWTPGKGPEQQFQCSCAALPPQGHFYAPWMSYLVWPSYSTCNLEAACVGISWDNISQTNLRLLFDPSICHGAAKSLFSEGNPDSHGFSFKPASSLCFWLWTCLFLALNMFYHSERLQRGQSRHTSGRRNKVSAVGEDHGKPSMLCQTEGKVEKFEGRK